MRVCVRECVKVGTTLYQNQCVISFQFFCCWYEERVQRVFHVIKVNRAEVCVYCRKHKLLQIEIVYTNISFN